MNRKNAALLKCFSMIALFIMSGCKKGEEAELKANVTLELTESTLSENEVNPSKIVVKLDNPLPNASTVTFNVFSELTYGSGYNTLPESDVNGVCTIKIDPGVTETALEIYSVDNDQLQGDHNVTLQLAEVSSNLQLTVEQQTSFDVTLEDDESDGDVTVGFREVSTTLSENAWPKFASTWLIFSQVPVDPVTITFREITALQWGYEYDSFYGPNSTTPKCNNGFDCEVTIEFTTNEKEVYGIEAFTFNNSTIDGERTVVFEIVEVSNGLSIEEGRGTFTLFVIDDD